MDGSWLYRSYIYIYFFLDESVCGEPEEPVAGHVVVGPDASAIYSCDAGYRLLAEPNRTCERDGHWTGHAPQCEGIFVYQTELTIHKNIIIIIIIIIKYAAY